jgi:prepilin-type N-terminal cleavage/methylation domain-containing protein
MITSTARARALRRSGTGSGLGGATPAGRADAVKGPALIARAFTLIEVAVAMALVGVIAAAGTTIVLQLNRSLKAQAARQRADEEAKQLAEWLIFELRGVGGEALRPWEAISVQGGETAACAAAGDVPACDNSDRLVVTFVDNDLPACPLVGNSGVNLHSARQPNPSGGPPATVCCLDLFGGAVAANSPWEDRSALVLDARRGVHRVALHNRTSSGPGNCAVNVPGGLPATLATADIPGGQLVGAIQRVYFRAPADDAGRGLRKNGLYEFTDRDSDGRFDAGELQLIADNVLDLQFALGHDRDADGRIVDRTSTDDEWFGNASGDTLPATLEADRLRMVGVAIVVAVPLPAGEPNTTARVFNGPVRTAISAQARATVTRAYLRNIFLFD